MQPNSLYQRTHRRLAGNAVAHEARPDPGAQHREHEVFSVEPSAPQLLTDGVGVAQSGERARRPAASRDRTLDDARTVTTDQFHIGCQADARFAPDCAVMLRSVLAINGWADTVVHFLHGSALPAEDRDRSVLSSPQPERRGSRSA